MVVNNVFDKKMKLSISSDIQWLIARVFVMFQISTVKAVNTGSALAVTQEHAGFHRTYSNSTVDGIERVTCLICTEHLVHSHLIKRKERS